MTLMFFSLLVCRFDTIAREWRLKWSADDDKVRWTRRPLGRPAPWSLQLTQRTVYSQASLAAAQACLDGMLDKVKGVKGVKSVQRVVCGGCLDFKVRAWARRDFFLWCTACSPAATLADAQVITSLSADDFGAWEEAGFAPEEDFLAKVKAIDGVSLVETQTFTLMPM